MLLFVTGIFLLPSPPGGGGGGIKIYTQTHTYLYLWLFLFQSIWKTIINMDEGPNPQGLFKL